jgi:class 3 adenylate cyclase/DNA-binding winged helix-turn-helix (wHTH) protein/TolB-like protein/tetratricopeptide (TPR) repeat protein
MERRLTAILAADVVGYSRLIGLDETHTLDALRSIRSEVIDPIIEKQNGRIFKVMGDGLLVEFASVVDAVSAAIEVQKKISKQASETQDNSPLSFRIGVNIGDVVVEDGDIFGDGVNVAARLQEIAAPHGIAISEAVHRELRGKLEVTFEHAGAKELKNIIEPVRTWIWPASTPKNQPADRNILAFDSFTIDLDAAVIKVSGDVAHVEPQVFDLIALMCKNPGRLLAHDELIEKVWNGRIVSDSAIASRINAARKALGDDGQRQEVIKTVRGRGFRFELTPISGRQTELRSDNKTDSQEKFVLSCTPHGYSILMATRTDNPGSEHYKALPVFLAEAASTNNGITEKSSLAVFDDCADALKCAKTLIQTIENRCKTLNPAERWTAKIGIAYGTLNHGFAHALAGRADAVSEPGGICITKRALDMLDKAFSAQVAVISDGDGIEDSSPYKLTRVLDWQLPVGNQIGPAQVANLQIPKSSEISIIVLPFEVIGDSEELQQVALGVRIEIHNALTQLSGIMPMAAGTAAAFSGTASPEAAQALGVRYVLHGHTRSIGRQVRFMLELYDHELGGVGWSNAYEGSLDDGFDFQDQMTTRVVRAVDVKVLSGEQARIWHKSFSDVKAIRLQYKGIRDFFRMSKECMRAARESFEQLYDMHPEVHIGATLTALCHWFDIQRGWAEDKNVAMAAAEKWAKIAIGMEDADGQAHTALCHVHILRGEFDEAEAIGKEAVTIRPSCANANGFYAHCLYYCGSLDKAIHHARLAIRFSPAYPPMFAAVLAGALHANGEHETAIAVAKEGQRINASDLQTGLILCSALSEAGRNDQARLVAVNLLRSHPNLDAEAFIGNLPFRRPEMGAQLIQNCTSCIGTLD